MKALKTLLLVAGVILLGILIATNDPAEIFASITRLSWRLLVVICFPFVLVTTFDTLGWRYAFVRDAVPFGTLLWARVAGEAFNLTTPTAALGGEAVKAWILRGHVRLDEGISSVIVAKTTITIGQGLFLLIGIVVAWFSDLRGSPLVSAMLWLLVVEVVALGLFVIAQTRGMFGWGRRALERLELGAGGSAETVYRVDRGLAQFYRTEPRRLVLSLLFHLVAWLLGTIEAWLILRFLGVPASLTTATIIEAFGTAVRFAAFMIPGTLGVLEGAYAVTFVALGLPAPLGVSFGITRRVREIVWAGVGLIAFAVMRMRPRLTSPAPSDVPR
jgi:uncharacterized protein (TIRG00374 family)